MAKKTSSPNKNKLKLIVVGCPKCGKKLFCKLDTVDSILSPIIFCTSACGGRCNDSEGFDIEKNVIGGYCTHCKAEEFFN